MLTGGEWSRAKIMYEAKLHVEDIAKVFNTSRGVIIIGLRKMGVKVVETNITPIEVQNNIIAMRQQKPPVSYPKIHKELGVSANAARSVWSKYVKSLEPKVIAIDSPLDIKIRAVDATVAATRGNQPPRKETTAVQVGRYCLQSLTNRTVKEGITAVCRHFKMDIAWAEYYYRTWRAGYVGSGIRYPKPCMERHV